MNVDLARTHAFRLAFIARNIAFYRTLASLGENYTQNFWIYVSNNFLDMAVLEWCKVFGSRAEETHWSNIVEEHDAFRDNMLVELSLTREQWDSYWEEMKDYRARGVAHASLTNPPTRYPHLDNALHSSAFYYRYLVEELRKAEENPLYLLPGDLMRYYEPLLAHAKEVASVAYGASREIVDNIR